MVHMNTVDDDMIRYDRKSLTCADKLTDSQLSPPQGSENGQKNKEKN